MSEIAKTKPGFYWARYKDHGWVLILVVGKTSLLPRIAYEVSDFDPDYTLPIHRDVWSKYIDLREVAKPSLYE